MVSPPTIALSVGAAVSAVLAIAGRDREGWRLLQFIFKPATTILILVLAALARDGSTYADLIIIGLISSLLGDIALMLPPAYFLAGVGSFAITQALYLAAFVGPTGWALLNPTTVPVALLAVLLTLWLWPGIRGSLRIPVGIYIVLISSMLVQVLGAAIAEPSPRLVTAAAGAGLFFVSDALLAVDRFRAPFRGAGFLRSSVYWVGQWLIALSIQPGLLGLG